MMDNRDYFTRPIQGNGRDFHGYGNTNLARGPRRQISKIGVLTFVVFDIFLWWLIFYLI